MQRILIVLIAVVVRAVPGAALDIVSCGVTVPRGEVGVLQADLACPASPFVVRLLRGATLDLNGHSLQGGNSTTAAVVGVGADDGQDPIGIGPGRFTIVGPGSIAGVTNPPFYNGTQACVLISNGRVDIGSDTGIVDIHHCINGIRGSIGDDGPNGHARAFVAQTSVHDTVDAAISVGKLHAANTSVSQNLGMGVSADKKLIATDVTANDNGAIGLYARVIKGTNVTTQNNGNNGIDACVYGTSTPQFGRAVIANLVSTGNGVYGVCADRVRLRSSDVTGNSYRDIFTVTQPHLDDTMCGTSWGMNAATASWGVCSAD